MDTPEDRRAIEAGLNASLGIAAHNAKNLPEFARKQALELGLTYFGELSDSSAPILVFYRTDLGEHYMASRELRGPSAWKVLPTIGRVKGFFAIPRQLLLGIRGEHGDVLMRVTDIQVYRFEAVADFIRDQNDQG
jgi:hypothetical protein